MRLMLVILALSFWVVALNGFASDDTTEAGSDGHVDLIEKAARAACDGLRAEGATNWLDCMRAVEHQLEDLEPVAAQALIDDVVACRDAGSASQSELLNCLRHRDKEKASAETKRYFMLFGGLAVLPLLFAILGYRERGIFAGLGYLWLGSVAMSVVAAWIGNFLGSDSFWDGLRQNQEMMSPFNLYTYGIIMFLALPGAGLLMLQDRLDKRRSARD